MCKCLNHNQMIQHKNAQTSKLHLMSTVKKHWNWQSLNWCVLSGNTRTHKVTVWETWSGNTRSHRVTVWETQTLCPLLNPTYMGHTATIVFYARSYKESRWFPNYTNDTLIRTNMSLLTMLKKKTNLEQRAPLWRYCNKIMCTFLKDLSLSLSSV